MNPVPELLNQFFSGAIGFYCLACFINVLLVSHRYEEMLSRDMVLSMRFLVMGLFVFLISQVTSLLPGTYYIYNIVFKFGAVSICIHSQLISRAIKKAHDY